MDPKELPSGELLTLFEATVGDHARCRLAALKERSSKVRAGRWAAMRSTETALTPIRLELFRRMGVSVPVEVSNRLAFVYLAASKNGRLCGGCLSSACHSRYLQWWTKDAQNPEPLLLVQAHQGATSEQLQELRKLCVLLCSQCARERGARLLKGGRPDVKWWLQSSDPNNARG